MGNWSCRLGLVLSAAILAACAQQTPPPKDPTAVSKTVLSGHTTNLGFWYSVNGDCTPEGTPAVRLTVPPLHGTVQIVDREDFPNFPQTNARFECDKKRVLGEAVDYTSAPGYLGPDYFAYEVIFIKGNETGNKVTVTVK